MNAKTVKKKILVTVNVYEDYSVDLPVVDPSAKNNRIRVALHRSLMDILRVKRDLNRAEAAKLNEQAKAKAEQDAKDAAAKDEAENTRLQASKAAKLLGLEGEERDKKVEELVLEGPEALQNALNAGMEKAAAMAEAKSGSPKKGKPKSSE